MRRVPVCLPALVSALLAACGSPPSPPNPPAPATPPSAQAPPAAPTASSPPRSTAPESLDEHVRRLHAEAIVVDGHDDVPSLVLQHTYHLHNPRAWHTHTDLARMKAGGITAEFFSIYVDKALAEKPTSAGGGPARRALDLID